MKSIDREAVKSFQAEAVAALNVLAKKHGLLLKPGSVRFSADRMAMKYEFIATTPTETGTPGKPADFDRNARLLGYPEGLFGKVFESQGTKFRITNLSLRRPKFPIEAVRLSDGKGFKFVGGPAIFNQ